MKVNGYYHHAKFDIYQIYGIRENFNVKESGLCQLHFWCMLNASHLIFLYFFFKSFRLQGFFFWSNQDKNKLYQENQSKKNGEKKRRRKKVIISQAETLFHTCHKTFFTVSSINIATLKFRDAMHYPQFQFCDLSPKHADRCLAAYKGQRV